MNKNRSQELEHQILSAFSELAGAPVTGIVFVIQGEQDVDSTTSLGVGGIGVLSTKHSQLGALILGADIVRGTVENQDNDFLD